MNIEPSSLPHVLSNVTSRCFFPRMKIGDVLASLKVKPGFGAFAVDFHIVKDVGNGGGFGRIGEGRPDVRELAEPES
ncbi:hypothetical protein ACHQM5_008073 [Ranunculus cassubicifolius]